VSTQDDFDTAGLLEPSRFGVGPDRIELLEWLEDRGFTIEEMVEAHAMSSLGALAADRTLRPRPDLSSLQAAQRLGIGVEEFDRWRRSLGLTPQDPDALWLSESDVDAVARLLFAGEMFSVEEAHHIARVIASSLARVALAAVALFALDVERPLAALDAGELELAKRNVQAMGSVEELIAGLGPMLRIHVQQAIAETRRAAMEQGDGVLHDTTRLAVGFVDLVGFTAVSGAVSPRELGLLVREFEGRSHDIVSDNNARVVKLIGDAVMFVAFDPRDAVAAAAELLTAFVDERVTPRGGVANGEVLTRGGDYYGPVVNLASRIADLAVPAELLVVESVVSAAQGFDFEPAGRRQLKGFEEPVALFSLVSDSDDGGSQLGDAIAGSDRAGHNDSGVQPA